MRIGLEFTKIVNLKNSPLSEEMKQGASGEVVFGLEHAQEIRTAVLRLQSEKPETLERILSLGNRFRTGQLDAKEAEILASDTFDVISVLVSELSDWKIPESGGDNSEIRTAFVKNNL